MTVEVLNLKDIQAPKPSPPKKNLNVGKHQLINDSAKMGTRQKP